MNASDDLGDLYTKAFLGFCYSLVFVSAVLLDQIYCIPEILWSEISVTLIFSMSFFTHVQELFWHFLFYYV